MSDEEKMSKEEKMTNLLNGLTMFEKEELLDLLLGSGAVKVKLHDCCAGIWYEQGDAPRWECTGVWLEEQTLVIGANIKKFEAAVYRDGRTEEQYKGGHLASVPPAPKKKAARKKAAPKKKEVTK